MTLLVDSLPPLTWSNELGEGSFTGGTLTLTAGRGVDWSNDSLGGEQQHRATSLGFQPPAEFALSARAAVQGARTTFDAAVLTVWGDRDHWAKLCFEFSPRGEAMIVSVVTNEYSDDCNSTVVLASSTYLRVVRVGPAWAFHSSDDGRNWRFVRLFRLDFDGPISVGFMSQAPMGDTCTAVFDQIVYTDAAPRDLRDGS